MGETLTGRTARRSYDLAAQAQAEQRQRIREETERVAAVEAGERRILNNGGGGMLAFIDNTVAEEEQTRLRRQLGGAPA
jgi:diacylglycerol kinase family enzyme